MIANPNTYLKDLVIELTKTWPDNKTINLVFHGHSVPAGYFLTPYLNTYQSYPYQMHQYLKTRFPFAVINPIITAIGGENSVSGLKRFQEVLDHRPDLIIIDYGLNDRSIGLENAKEAWSEMIEMALKEEKKVLLVTPTFDHHYLSQNKDWDLLK